MAKESFLTLLRELVTCYQAFERVSSRHIRSLKLTPPQFDIIATLGNTPGMSCKELGERTLITKGTLTGVLDRLEARHLLSRRPDAEDARSTRISLTSKGQRLFEGIFPLHVDFLRPAFEHITPQQLGSHCQQLRQLRACFDQLEENPS
jgi:MarR family transcriptional regulator, 2-MHQ and catechol-resistance regulon repressor